MLTCIYCSCCFNSMIVRLKVCYICRVISAINKFQFYDSPIKRAQKYMRMGKIHKFQFYDSPIKRLAGALYPPPIQDVSIL